MIACLKNAGRQNTYADTCLYTTLIPCRLCAAAAMHFGIPRIVVGDSVHRGAPGKILPRDAAQLIDLKSAECIEMLNQFVREKPEFWEDFNRQ